MRWYQKLGTVLTGLVLVGFIYVSIPVPDKTYTIPFNIENVPQGTLKLTVPTWLKVGDTVDVRLQISYLPEDVNGAEPQQLDLISQLEIGFLELTPKGQGNFSMSRGSTVVLKWQLKPQVEADYSGTVWLFQQQPDQEEQLILGKGVEFKSKMFLGLPYKMARIISLCGMIIGIILLIPFVWDKIIKERIECAQGS